MSKPASNTISPRRDLLRRVAGRLRAAGRDEAELKAEWLVAHVLGVPRLELAAGTNLPDEQALEPLIARAVAGEPIQYILGTVSFRGHELRCDRRALIPRPETEQLVDLALAARPDRAADVGTGSGCIAIALARERPGCRVVATDVSAESLALARENAARLGVSHAIEFRLTDLLEGATAGVLDVVVSNPPYVASAERASLAVEIRDHEPRAALEAGRDGLDVIRRLVPQAFHALAPGGRLFMEIGETQAAAVCHLMKSSGFIEAGAGRDLAGHERFVWGTRP